MKKSEKILGSIAVIALGLLFIILKADFISILMTVLGACLVIFGIIDCVEANVPSGVIKIVSGVLLTVAGWAIVEAVLYILSALMLIFGILWLYAFIKDNKRCGVFWRTILTYAEPVICIAIGVLLLFHHSDFIDLVMIITGILTMLEGSTMLLFSIAEQD